MTDRAHLEKLIQDNQGNVLTASTVTLYEPGTLTPITDSLYVDNEGATTLTNPFSCDDGQISVYLSQPRRVRLGVQATGQVPQFFEDIDVLLPASVSGAVPMTSHTLTFSKAGALSAPYTSPFQMFNDSGSDWKVLSLRATVGTAPVGASLKVSLHDGATLLGTAEIVAGTTTARLSLSAAPPVVLSGDAMTVTIDQVGSTTAGSDLSVQVVVANN